MNQMQISFWVLLFPRIYHMCVRLWDHKFLRSFETSLLSDFDVRVCQTEKEKEMKSTSVTPKFLTPPPKQTQRKKVHSI